MTQPKVTCYSGKDDAGQPKTLLWRGKTRAIRVILAEWDEPEGKGFRVITVDGAVFDLFYDQNKNTWDISKA